MQMPNVFVVPPEEDESPTWCFFDAAHPALSHLVGKPETPDIHVFSFPDSNNPSPLPRDPLTSSEDGTDSRSIVEALDDGNEVNIYHDVVDTDSEYEHDIELGGALSSVHSEPSRTVRDSANDSDVIEVVKVRRNKHSSRMNLVNEPLTSELKRSKTLKSRASKAFRSLKGSLRTSRPRVQDAFASVKSDDIVMSTMSNTSPRPPTPSISRRGSRILSQLFVSPSLKSRSSFSLDEPTDVSQPEPVFFASTSSSVTDRLSCRSSLYENESLQDEDRLKAASPIPTPIINLKPKNRRFSILSLHKLFSFSSPASTPPSPISLTFDDSTCTTPTLRSTSCTPSSVTSVCTTSSPQTPMNIEEGLLSQEQDSNPVSFASVLGPNEAPNLGLGLSMDSLCDTGSSEEHTPRAPRTFRSSLESTISASENVDKKTPYPASTSGPGVFQHDDPRDLSFEMHLDSLHFDSLSFDADRFFVTNSN